MPLLKEFSVEDIRRYQEGFVFVLGKLYGPATPPRLEILPLDRVRPVVFSMSLLLIGDREGTHGDEVCASGIREIEQSSENWQGRPTDVHYRRLARGPERRVWQTLARMMILFVVFLVVRTVCLGLRLAFVGVRAIDFLHLIPS